MKAIVLCAGFATRLYPLTLNQPKALLEVKGKPILDYIIEKIEQINVDDIYVVCNEKFYMNFIWWLEKHKDKKIEIVNDGTTNEEERLEVLGDLDFVIKEKKIDEDILLIFGDNLFDFSLSDFVDFFNKNRGIVFGVRDIQNIEEAKKFGVVEVKDNRIVSIEEKPDNPKSSLISTGIYVFPKESLHLVGEHMKTPKPKKGPAYLVQDLLEKERVYAFLFKGRWFDIGSIETYEEVKEIW